MDNIGIWLLILLIWLIIGIVVNDVLEKKFPKKREIRKGYPTSVQVPVYLLSALIWPIHLIMTYISYK